MQKAYWGMGRIKERKVIWKWRHERGGQTENREREGTECRDQKPWMRLLKPFFIWCEAAPIWINFAVDTPGVTDDWV